MPVKYEMECIYHNNYNLSLLEFSFRFQSNKSHVMVMFKIEWYYCIGIKNKRIALSKIFSDWCHFFLLFFYCFVYYLLHIQFDLKMENFAKYVFTSIHYHSQFSGTTSFSAAIPLLGLFSISHIAIWIFCFSSNCKWAGKFLSVVCK